MFLMISGAHAMAMCMFLLWKLEVINENRQFKEEINQLTIRNKVATLWFPWSMIAINIINCNCQYDNN